MRNDEDKDNLKSLFEKIFGVSWPEEWDTNGTSQKKRGKSVGESLMSRTDWRWAYEDQTPQYRLSEDETEILADYADYEETYIRIPRNRKEFEELDANTQLFIHQYVGLLPWEAISKNPAEDMTKSVLIITISILAVMSLIILVF